MKQCNYSREALFQLNGIPPLGMSISLALQHLVAMIVGCVTPAIIIANALGLPQSERVLLIQVSLVMSAVTTLIELFPIGGKLGSGLPVMFGISFAYLPSMQAIVGGGGDIATIAGAMVIGSADFSHPSSPARWCSRSAFLSIPPPSIIWPAAPGILTR